MMLKWYVNGSHFFRIPLWTVACFTLASCTPSAVNVGSLKNLLTTSSSVNLNATPADSQVSLSWGVTLNATAYSVVRGISPDGPFATINTNVMSASFVDTTVTNGVTYYYQVVPQLQNGTSGKPSLIGSATPVGATALSAPAGLHYAAAPFLFTKGTAMTPAALSNAGGAIASCTVNPLFSAGLVLDPSTCTLSGTPTAVSTATSYTIRATNASGSATTIISMGVNDIAPSIAYPSTPYSSTLGQASSITATSSGGAITNCSISPALPAGLSISTSTCSITGTATALSPNTTYTSTATSFGGSTSTATVNITVQDVAPSALAFAGAPFTLTQNSPMTAATSTHSGGTLISCSAGSLPPGISVSPVFGECQISGTPTTVAGTTAYTISATNSGGSTPVTLNFTINAPAAPALSFVGAPFTLTKDSAMTPADSTHTGGSLIICSASGLPAGLSISFVGGECRLSGTPTVVTASANYVVSAANAAGDNLTASISITVNTAVAVPMRFAYTTTNQTFNGITTKLYSYTYNSGVLTDLSTPVDLYKNTLQLTGDPLGRFLFIGHDIGNGIDVFSVNQTSGVVNPTPTSGSVTCSFVSGPCAANTAAYENFSIHPNSKYLYNLSGTGGLGSTLNITKLDINQTTGALSSNTADTPSILQPASGNPGVIVHPSGKYLYAYSDTTILMFDINATDGTLTLHSPSASTSSFITRLFIDPQGKFVYVSTNSGNMNFKVGTSGTLTNGVSFQACCVDAIHPSGLFAYGAGQGSAAGRTLVYAVDPSTGLPGNTPTLTLNDGSFTPIIEPQGKYLLGSDDVSTVLRTFSIDQNTGNLTSTTPATTSSAPTTSQTYFTFLK